MWIKDEAMFNELIAPILESSESIKSELFLVKEFKPVSYPALYLIEEVGKVVNYKDVMEVKVTTYTKEDFIVEGVSVDDEGRISFSYGDKIKSVEV